jgi:hypothetical protein
MGYKTQEVQKDIQWKFPFLPISQPLSSPSLEAIIMNFLCALSEKFALTNKKNWGVAFEEKGVASAVELQFLPLLLTPLLALADE